MKKEKWLIAIAAGAGAGVLAYSLLSKNIPAGAVAVENFDLERYLGKWNEIARLPNRVEKNLVDVTDTYTACDDGTYRVVTKAYNRKKKTWKEYSGKVKLACNKTVGMLKVSYFEPLYLSYNVLAVDESYKYALVTGSSLHYLWILSKDKFIPERVKTQFLALAEAIGFETGKLEWL